MTSMADNSSRVALVTGATGLLGSHIAEQLRRRGFPVRAICRAGSDTAFLRGIGVELIQGDLSDAASLRRACEGADCVYHAAARVGDWGPWRDFVEVSIEGTRRLMDAAVEARVRRFLHISSISVYGHLDGEGRVFDESAPIGQNLYRWSYYSRAKVEAERLVWEAHRAGRVPVTVVRPSWMYGQRDRASLPRLIDSIRRGKLRLMGDGENRLNLVNAANVGEACVLAGNAERAVGEAYNCSHDGAITQASFFNRVSAALGAAPIQRSIAYPIARSAAFAMECVGHLLKLKRPPLITRYSVWLMGRRCFFECQKLRTQLDWSSSIRYEEGIPAAVESYLAHERAAAAAAPGARIGAAA